MNTKSLTYGAVLGAMSIVFALIANYLNSPDSLFYFLVSVPVVYYTYKFKFSDSCVLISSITIICLLVTNPITCFLLTLPCLLIGLLLGLSFRRSKVFIFLAIILSFSFDLVVTYNFAVFFGVDFILSIEEMMMLLTGSTFAVDLAVSLIPSFLLFYAIIKVMFIYVISSFVIKRFDNDGIISVSNSSFYRFNRLNASVYILIYLILIYLIRYLLTSDSVVLIATINVLFVLFLIDSFYILCQTNIYIVNRHKIKKRFILALLSVFIFPFLIIYGLFLNFIYGK